MLSVLLLLWLHHDHTALVVLLPGLHFCFRIELGTQTSLKSQSRGDQSCSDSCSMLPAPRVAPQLQDFVREMRVQGLGVSVFGGKGWGLEPTGVQECRGLGFRVV